jgi:hypothetical protein
VLKDALRGAAATAVMSLPMGVRWLAQSDVPPPPMTIAERVQRAVGVEPAKRGPFLRHATWIGAHLGFGATVGAVATVWPTRARTRPSAGAYGLAIWAVNYAIGLPALRLYPRVTRDARLRAVETLLSHLVYAEALRAFGAPAGRRRRHRAPRSRTSAKRFRRMIRRSA